MMLVVRCCSRGKKGWDFVRMMLAGLTPRALGVFIITKELGFVADSIQMMS